MKKIIILVIAFVIIIFGYIFFKKKLEINENSLSFNNCVIKENKGSIIFVNIAQTFAQKHVLQNNKPYDWVPVGYYPVYDSSDSINYYGFVFRKTDYTKLTTLDELEKNASNYSLSNDDRYQFNNIASVWTGASEGQKILMRHYRGIPEIIAEKEKIKQFVKDKYGDKTIGNIIADSEAGKMYLDIVSKSDGKSTGDVIGLDYSIVSKNELIKSQEKIEERRYTNLSNDSCNSTKQAILEREADLKRQWNEVINY